MMLRIGAGRIVRAGEGETDVIAVFAKASVVELIVV